MTVSADKRHRQAAFQPKHCLSVLNIMHLAPKTAPSGRLLNKTAPVGPANDFTNRLFPSQPQNIPCIPGKAGYNANVMSIIRLRFCNCYLKTTGMVITTATGFPLCFPGVHFPVVSRSLTAAALVASSRPLTILTLLISPLDEMVRLHMTLPAEQPSGVF